MQRPAVHITAPVFPATTGQWAPQAAREEEEEDGIKGFGE